MKQLSYILFLSFLALNAFSQDGKSLYLHGKIIDRETKEPLRNISVKINNSTIATETDKSGHFEFFIPKIKHLTLIFSSINYKKEVREIDTGERDTIWLSVSMKNTIYDIAPIDITAKPKPDTVFGTTKFSIIDFDFYEDNYFLLTDDIKTNKQFIRLCDNSEKLIHSVAIPKGSGKANSLYHDYMGYTNIICEDSIYRVLVIGDKIYLGSLPVEDYNALVKPVIDTVQSHFFFSNYSKNYPLFSYFNYKDGDTSSKAFHTVEDKDLMHAYRFEYYSLKPRERLDARNIEQEFGIDRHMAAAMISGFTQSMFYTPLYAPLFVVKDTICIFDHYKDCLFHYDKNSIKIDSIPINYHHPKNWKEWKNLMVKDFTEDDVYAIYDNSGHKYLKMINIRNGKDQGRYDVIHYSADKIRVKDGYIYYVYRPFASMQEKYLYKEKIVLDKK